MKSTRVENAPLHERVVALEATLSPSERNVARYLADHPDLVASSTAVELGAHTQTSNATVIRTVKALGYTGLPELKRILVQAMVDRRDPARILGQRIERLDADGAIADQVLLATAELLNHARRIVEPTTWRRATDILDTAHSVLCYGIEQAGCVAEFLAIELARCGKPTRSLKQTGIGVANGLLPLTGDDAVVVIAPLRHFREIDVVVDHARSLGTPVIMISEALGMTFENRVDAVLQTPQTTLGIASEVIAAMTLVRALVLEIASRNRELAIATHGLLNQLRSQAVGADLDAALPPIDGQGK